MINTNSTDFARLITGFLTDYLPLQRGYAKNTILSYRDTLKLFLRFLNDEKGISPNSFYVKDFKREIVIEFLEWYRQNGAGISAANQRLAAIKAFADYAQFENVESIALLQNISGIKSKKGSPKEVSFISTDQMSKLINRPDINSYIGFRHRVLLTLLYDSGCRVQELCDITLADLALNDTSTVRLHGKGNKYRTIVISDETGKLIKKYTQMYLSTAVGTQPLITNRYHQKIHRDGVAYIIKKYADVIRKEDPTFPKHIHCHIFRNPNLYEI
jgi:site-specific recombinase XerD